METRTDPIASLFQSGLFDIPEYQRPYSWTDPQLSDLLEDLVYLPDDGNHFFGNIILDPQDEDYRTDQGRRFSVYDVVDGQQRLTTAIILLSVAAQKDDTVAETVAADNLIHPLGKRPRLLPQDQDKEYFRDALLGTANIQPETPSQERLQNAVQFYDGRLEKLPDGVSIQDIAERIRYDCRVNIVELTMASEAASIFESINDRGRPLSSLDKTKSFLMYMDDRTSNWERLHDQINDRFGKIYHELFVFTTGHDRVTEFDEDSVQRFHWGLYDGYHSNEYFSPLPTLKKRLREQYRQGAYDAAQQEIDEYTQGLRETASAFAELFHPAQRPDPVEYRLRRLLELGRLANVLPVLIAAQLRFGDEHPAEMATIIEQCEVFVFRLYAIGSYRSDTGRGKLVSLAHSLRTEDSMTAEMAVDQLTTIIRGYVDDDRFRRELTDPEFYKVTSSQDIRFLLHHYGRHLNAELGEQSSGDLSKILSSDFEVEHILARNLDPRHVPADLTADFEEHVHRLGNLTIASSSWNKAFGNLPFSEKKVAGEDQKEGYNHSGLRVQRDLAKHDTFDRETLDERENKIVDFALREWAVNMQSEGSVPPPFYYQSSFDDDDALPTSDSVSIDESDHDTLVATLRQAPSRTWVETTLELLRDLIGEFDLDPEDSRLVTTTGKGDRIAVSVNNRYVLMTKFDGIPKIGLLVEKAAAEDGELLSQVAKSGSFSPLPGESESAVPYFIRVHSEFAEELDDHLHNAWLAGVGDEIHRASSSPYQQHHQPLLYKAAVDRDYRERLLTDTFDMS